MENLQFCAASYMHIKVTSSTLAWETTHMEKLLKMEKISYFRFTGKKRLMTYISCEIIANMGQPLI